MFNKTRSVWILTATAFVATMVVFAPAIQAAGRGNEWIALRYRFQPGERLEYALTITTSATNIMSGPRSQQEIPVATKTKMNLRYEVLDVDSEGAATVKMTLDEINSDVQSMGQSINVRIGASGTKMHSGGMLLFDSNQMAGGKDVPISEMLGFATMPDGVHFDDLFRKGITARISKLGEMSLPDIEQGGSENFMGMLEYFEPERLPKKLVRPGDGWSSGFSLPGVDEEKAKLYGLTAEHTFEGIEDLNGRRCAKISSKADIDLSQRPDVLELIPKVNAFKSRGEGVSYLDIETGRPLKMVAEVLQETQSVQSFGFPGLGMDTGSAPQSVEVAASIKIVVEMELKEE